MASSRRSEAAILKVIDALDHPYGDRILRTRILEGEPPTVGDLRKARLRAKGPEGDTVDLRVVGFPLFGGTPSDGRIRETRRVDLLVSSPSGDSGSVDVGWELCRPEG